MESSVGARLRATRLRREHSGAEMAEACGVSRQTVSGWEQGHHLPTPRHLRAAAKYLRVDPYWLRTGVYDGKPTAHFVPPGRARTYADLRDAAAHDLAEFERMIEEDIDA